MSETSKINGKTKERPLSPHLQVYRPQMTSVLSILHRACGYALSVGIAVFVWMLVATAIGPDAYYTFQWFVDTPIGRLMLFGWSFALFYHMCNGIRHLFWDMGYLFKIENAYKAGYAVMASSTVLTILFWWMVCHGA